MKEFEYYITLALTPTAVPIIIGMIVPDIVSNIMVYRQVKSNLEKKEGGKEGLIAALQSAEEIMEKFKGKRIKSILNCGEVLAARSYFNYKSKLYGYKQKKKK